MGRNVADPDPYVTLDTSVPGEGGSGIDLFGTGEGYRPGRATYSLNGFPITEAVFMEMLGGSFFGLIQMAARMSAARYLVTDTYVTEAVYWGTDWDQAKSAAYRSETMTVHRVFFEGWSFVSLIVPISMEPDDIVRVELPDDFRNRIERRLNARLGACNKFLQRLLSDTSAYTHTNKGEIVLRSSLENDRTGNEKPYAEDGLTLLDAIRTFQLVNNLQVGGLPVGGTIAGSIPQGNATVMINSHWRFAKGTYSNYVANFERVSREFYLVVAIHEMVHHACYYCNDEFLAKVLYDMGETDRIPGTRPGETASDILHDAIKKYCGTD